jgi:hypothetical protein
MVVVEGAAVAVAAAIASAAAPARFLFVLFLVEVLLVLIFSCCACGFVPARRTTLLLYLLPVLFIVAVLSLFSHVS